jgi:hypothetical protein
MMDRVQKPSNFGCYTLSSESIRLLPVYAGPAALDRMQVHRLGCVWVTGGP